MRSFTKPDIQRKILSSFFSNIDEDYYLSIPSKEIKNTYKNLIIPLIQEEDTQKGTRKGKNSYSRSPNRHFELTQAYQKKYEKKHLM